MNGTNSKAYFAYGIDLDNEEIKVPWDDEEDDWDSWWLQINGQEWDTYEEKYARLKDTPMPFDVVYHGSPYDRYKAIIVPGTEQKCYCGECVTVDIDHMDVNSLQLTAYIEFINRFFPEYEGPEWLLMVYSD